MRYPKRSFKLWLAALLVVAAITSPAVVFAATFNLCAGETTVTMPDGTVITVWGFTTGDDTTPADGVCDDTLIGTPITVPGPELRDNVGGNITINLTNTLPVPVSLQIPGQTPLGADVVPVWIDPTSSTPMTDAGTPSATRPLLDTTSRPRSFVKETALYSVGPADVQAYTFTSPRNGTFLYQSATQPQVQVQMGLYGALIYEPSAGDAYSGIGNDGRNVTYIDDQVLLFSEYDADLHDAVASGNYGPTGTMTSTIDYDPDYYLINGVPYSSDQTPTALTATQGDTVMLRFLNAGYDSVAPAVLGAGYLSLQAEDGFGYPYARSEYAIDLPAGKTVDATFTSPADGYITVYDRRLNLSAAGGGPASGGQLTYLQVGNAVVDNLTINKVAPPNGATGDGEVAVASMPGGMVCPVGQATCTASYVANTSVRLVAKAAPGSGFKGWSGDCAGYDDCSVNLDAPKTVNASFKAFNVTRMLSLNTAGSKFTSQDMVPIYVAAPANTDTYKYSLSTDNGATWQRITRKITGNSGFNWLIPELPALVPKARIKVEAYDVNKVLIGTDMNNAPFRIKVVKMLTPAPGSDLVPGSDVLISWSTHTSSIVGSVKLEYRKTAARPWFEMVTLQGNPGTYLWENIPAANNPRSDARVKVTLYDRSGNKIDADQPDGVLNWLTSAPPM